VTRTGGSDRPIQDPAEEVKKPLAGGRAPAASRKVDVPGCVIQRSFLNLLCVRALSQLLPRVSPPGAARPVAFPTLAVWKPERTVHPTALIHKADVRLVGAGWQDAECQESPTTSPLTRVTSAARVRILIPFRKNCAWPSANTALAY
jgi:hypothetical protein